MFLYSGVFLLELIEDILCTGQECFSPREITDCKNFHFHFVLRVVCYIMQEIHVHRPWLSAVCVSHHNDDITMYIVC